MSLFTVHGLKHAFPGCLLYHARGEETSENTQFKVPERLCGPARPPYNCQKYMGATRPQREMKSWTGMSDNWMHWVNGGCRAERVCVCVRVSVSMLVTVTNVQTTSLWLHQRTVKGRFRLDGGYNVCLYSTSVIVGRVVWQAAEEFWLDSWTFTEGIVASVASCFHISQGKKTVTSCLSHHPFLKKTTTTSFYMKGSKVFLF